MYGYIATAYETWVLPVVEGCSLPEDEEAGGAGCGDRNDEDAVSG